MIDYATEVRNRLLDPWTLISSLGLGAKAKKTGGGYAIRCPNHDDSDPSCTVRIGNDGTIAVHCFTCGPDFSGDALRLIAKVRGLNEKSADEFKQILTEGAEIAGDLLLADEIMSGKRNESRAPAPVPEKIPEKSYPPQQEVLDMWTCAHPVESAPAAVTLLESRAIPTASLARIDCARVLPPGCRLPPWAVFGGRPWSSSGHRMICRVVDSRGVVRSVRAWQIDSSENPSRLPPYDHSCKRLVLANREAAKMLAGKFQPKRLIVCEGEPDWLTWATRVPDGVAVIGVGSGWWDKEFADRIPKTCQVIVRTDLDPPGERYAKQVIDDIADRCPAWRRKVDKSGLWLDENDLARAGTLPSDPEVGCEPANDSAYAELNSRPRIFTVRELLQQAHKRVISTEPIRILTTGHWKIDMMTGGIRPGYTWVMGADTSWGKSAWALMLADENMKKGFRVLIVSSEDDEDIYGDRLLARRSGVDATRIRDRKCDTEDHRRIAAVVAAGEPLPVYLDARGKHYEKVDREIRAMVDGEGIDLVALDYVGECRLKKKSQDERLMFKEIGQMFRYSVKDHKRSGIVFSQLTIDDPSKPPTRKNIRECKDLGSGAEGIMLGWKPQNEVKGKGPDGISEVVKHKANSRVMLIDKAKGGRCGSVEMDWDDVTASFKRTLRPAYEEGYEIPGFEQADFDDLDDQFAPGF